MREKLGELTDEEFKTQIEAVLTNVTEKDKNQRAEYDRFWTEINHHSYQFDVQECDTIALKSLKKEEFQAYARELLYSESRRRLDTHYNSDAHKGQETGEIEGRKYDSIRVLH